MAVMAFVIAASHFNISSVKGDDSFVTKTLYAIAPVPAMRAKNNCCLRRNNVAVWPFHLAGKTISMVVI
jgi:hypothetical protein